MLRTFSLVGMAAQAEGRRLKARANAAAIRMVFLAGAGVAGLAAFVMLHVLGWFAARMVMGPVLSATSVLAADLVVMAFCLFLASRDRRSRSEIEAAAVRNVALTGAAQSAVGDLTGKAGPLLALGGIVLAALWPKPRGGRGT